MIHYQFSTITPENLSGRFLFAKGEACWHADMPLNLGGDEPPITHHALREMCMKSWKIEATHLKPSKDAII